MITVLVGVLAFLVGYAAATYLIARDPDLFRLGEDEIIVKKPAEGMVLVSVPPHLMRKLITNPDGFESHEARSMVTRGGR
jgi:hypothetical protein